MRLAVISDVHGNLPALEAVLADVKERRVDFTVNLGDCVTSPLWPKETFEILQSLALPTVRGNYDRWIEEFPDEKLSPSGRFARNALTPGQRRALHDLPSRINLEREFWPAMARPMTIARACWRSRSTMDVSSQRVAKF
jgi:3',5'-cyclic AMP phosphodiesterase CpdA